MGVAERSGSIELDGRRLAWRTVGAGPPLLLVNGYAATAADWDPTFLAVLGASFEVLCPDNRGVGGSQLGDAAAVSVEAMADDLLALLDARGVEAAPVVGWSMGGFVAQRLAARSPERVTRLALLGTDPGGSEAVRCEAAVWSALTDRSGTPREQATRLLALLFPPPLDRQIDALFGEAIAAARAQLSPRALAAQERAMAAWHARADASPPAPPAPPLPVLVLHGEEDVVIPVANAHALAVRWPGARVERVAGGGHAFMAQEPRRLAAAIARFAA